MGFDTAVRCNRPEWLLLALCGHTKIGGLNSAKRGKRTLQSLANGPERMLEHSAAKV